jgi:hypothetical protein
LHSFDLGVRQACRVVEEFYGGFAGVKARTQPRLSVLVNRGAVNVVIAWN